MGVEELRRKMGASIAESSRVGAGSAPDRPVATRQVSGKNRGMERTKDLARIELGRFITDPDQPRKKFHRGELEDLARSLADPAQGQMVPILARYDEGMEAYKILDGEKRYRAANLANDEFGASLSTLMAVIVDRDLSPAEILEWQITTNGMRSDADPLDKARSIKRLQELLGLKQAEVAARLKISQSAVSKLLAMLKLEPSVQAKVSEKKISKGAAAAIARVEPSAQAEVAAEVESSGKSGDQAEKAAKVARKAAPRKAPSARSKKPKPQKVTSRVHNHNGHVFEVRRGRGVDLADAVAGLRSFADTLESEIPAPAA